MMNCPNCGAPYDGTGRCEYCGTVFPEEQRIVRINISKPDAKELSEKIAEQFARAKRDQIILYGRYF